MKKDKKSKMETVKKLVQKLAETKTPIDKTDKMWTGIEAWKHIGGSPMVYPKLLFDIYMNPEHNAFTDAEGVDRHICVLVKSSRGLPSIALYNDAATLGAFFKVAKEQYGYDLETIYKNKNLSKKEPDMLSATDLKRKFGGRDERYCEILEKIYNNKEQNIYTDDNGKTCPMITKRKKYAFETCYYRFRSCGLYGCHLCGKSQLKSCYDYGKYGWRTVALYTQN